MLGSPLYWIRGFAEGHIAIMPAPQLDTVERTVLHWREEGVDIVVCLLEEKEIGGLVATERDLCEELGLEFLWFPLRDRSVPSSVAEFDAFVAQLVNEIKLGKSIAVHCRAGIGRASLVAIALLTQLHIAAEDALNMVAEARNTEVPQTEEQRQWILARCSRL